MDSLFPEKKNMLCIADENIPFVREAFATFGEVRTFPGRELTASHLKNADILLVRSVTTVNEQLLSGTGVKFVASATIGIDHIDLSYLKYNNIGFACAPGSNADSVAEYLLAALSFFSKKDRKPFSEMTLGVIGVGNIGGRVFRNALALGMNTILCDPPKERSTNCSLYRPLKEVLAEADIVSLHVPLENKGDDATVQMVNRSFLEEMKSGAVLINTSRGGIVDETALLDMRKKLGGVVLDVWQREPEVNRELIEAATIATPHIAGYSYDGKIRGTVALYEAACAFFYRKTEWCVPESAFGEKRGDVPVNTSETAIADTILSTYDIKEDDASFRKIVAMDDLQQRAGYFDQLRRDYPKRYEFTHYTLKKNNVSTNVLRILENLRFSVEV